MTKIATDPNFAPTPAQLLATALAGNTAITADGHYSNRNYILLGLILEKVMSKPANEQVNALLATVGMTNSAMPPPGDNTIPTPASVGYNREGGVAELAGTGVKAGPAVDNISNWGWTAGSAYSNVNDLAAGAATGFGSTLLPADIAQARIDGAKPINGGLHTYSEGLQSFGNGWIGHEGQAVGWETSAAYNTKSGEVFVAIVNETSSILAVANVQTSSSPNSPTGSSSSPCWRRPKQRPLTRAQRPRQPRPTVDSTTRRPPGPTISVPGNARCPGVRPWAPRTWGE